MNRVWVKLQSSTTKNRKQKKRRRKKLIIIVTQKMRWCTEQDAGPCNVFFHSQTSRIIGILSNPQFHKTIVNSSSFPFSFFIKNQGTSAVLQTYGIETYLHEDECNFSKKSDKQLFIGFGVTKSELRLKFELLPRKRVPSDHNRKALSRIAYFKRDVSRIHIYMHTYKYTCVRVYV